MTTNYVNNYLKQLTWKVNENANIGYSSQGLNHHLASKCIENFWLSEIYTPEIKEAHVLGDIHIHDLASLTLYCCGWDLYDILLRGFGGVTNKVFSKPAKHFRAVLGQVCNFLYTLTGEVSGAVALSSFDTYLAPFIRYDNLSYSEVKQGMQEFIFNMNVPTRVGCQCPFSNLTFDLVCPTFLKHTSVIIGGKHWDDLTYGDFQVEMDMINRAFCEVMLEGDGIGNLFSFPIPTYNVTKNFTWVSEVTNLIFEMASKYGIPYFANFINSDLSPEDARSMCCRLKINLNTLKRGGLFSSNPLTGSQGVVTLNLAAIAFRNKGKCKTSFMKDLKHLSELARKSLVMKRGVLDKYMGLNLYPYSKVYLENIYKRTGSYYSNHFSTLGVLAGNEACLNYLGVGIEHPEGQKFMKEILDCLLELLEKYHDEDKTLYNLEATPAEGCCYRLALCDKSRYPGIIQAGTKDVPYYTNSTQLPVSYTGGVGSALELQNMLQSTYTGGTVFHTFLGENCPDIDSCKTYIKQVFKHYTIPYLSITPTFSICPEHGYLSGNHAVCPVCGGNKHES